MLGPGFAVNQKMELLGHQLLPEFYLAELLSCSSASVLYSFRHETGLTKGSGGTSFVPVHQAAQKLIHIYGNKLTRPAPPE